MIAVNSSYPPRSQAWWMIAVFCFAGFVSYVHRLILSVLIVPMQADLQVGDSQISLLQGAAFALVYVFAGLPLGWLADRSQRRGLVVGGAIIWSLGTLLCGVAPTFSLLFAARIIVGIGEAALAPAAASMIADAFPPERRGTALGVFLMGMVVGGPAAIGIGGALLGMAEAGAFSAWPVLHSMPGWRIVLVLVGMFGLLVPLLVMSIKEPARRESAGIVNWLAVRRHLSLNGLLLVALLLAIAMLSVGDYGMYSWVPATLTRGFSMSAAEIGGYFAVITTVTGVAGALLGGAVSDWASERWGQGGRFGVAAAGAVLGVLAALLIAAPEAWLVLSGLGLWMLASSVGAISGIAALQQVMPNEMRGISMSLVAFCNTLLGLGIAPTAIALVTEKVYGNPDAVGLSIASVVAPAAAISIVLFVMARTRSVRSLDSESLG
jgi:MFS family permease